MSNKIKKYFSDLSGDKKALGISAVFSLFLALSFVIGGKIDVNYSLFNNFTTSDILKTVIWYIIVFAVSSNIIHLSLRNDFALKKEITVKRLYIKCFILFFIAWLPYFVINYPGIYTNDSVTMIKQALGIIPLENNFPIFYVLFLRLFINTFTVGVADNYQNIVFCIMCYSLVQMFIMSAILSKIICWLHHKNVPKYCLILSVVFFAFNPAIAHYSFVLGTDTLFAGLLLILSTFTYDIIDTGGKFLYNKKNAVCFILVSILCAIVRHNGFILVVLNCFVIICLFIKKSKKAITVSIVSVILPFILLNPIANLIKDPSWNSSMAGFTMPLQQMAYTYVNGGDISDEQLEYLNNMMPLGDIKQYYSAMTADDLVFEDSFDIDYVLNDKLSFIKTWFNIGKNNFSMYLKSYAMSTVGYWHINTPAWVVILPKAHEHDVYYESYTMSLADSRDSNPYSTLFFNYYLAKRIPVVRLLFTVAFWVWLMFFCVVILVAKKQGKYAASLIPQLGLFITMMLAAPVYVQFRYMLLLLYAIPFNFSVMFIRKGVDSIEQPQIL